MFGSSEGYTAVAEAVHMKKANAGSERLFIQFGLFPEVDQEKTEAEGRPMYKDVEYIRIIVPGDTKNQVHRPANKLDRQAYARQYAAFKEGEGEAHQGTMLKMWPGITRAEAENLAYFKVFTVEHLASISDDHLSRIGPIRHLIDRAQAYLDAAKADAPVEKLRAEMKSKDNELEVLRRQVKEASEAIAELRKNAGRK